VGLNITEKSIVPLFLAKRIRNTEWFVKGFFRLEGKGKIASLPKQSKQQRQDDADDEAGGDGKIETKLFSFNDDITGKFAHPWDFISNQ